jgi:integrase
MRFTRALVAGLTLPAGKTDFVYWDTDLPGFGVRIRGTTRRWVIQHRVKGISRREVLGDPRRITLDDARKIARARFAKGELGIDPAADRAKARAEADAAKLILGTVADRYVESRRPVVRASTSGKLTRSFKVYWKPLRHRPIADIKRAEVAARLGEIVKDHGRASAAAARSTLSAFYVWCMREGLCDANPVAATNNPSEGTKPRSRVLTDAELEVVWRHCGDDHFGRIVRLLMLTGCRREEIGGLRWDEINLDTGVITIPGERTKNHAELRLTLPAPVLALLPPRQDGGDFVFGAGRGFTGWSFCRLSLDNRIASEGRLPHWTLHDLRRTLRTGLSRLGVPPHISEAVLGHTQPLIIRTYDRYSYEAEVANALARWTAHVESVVTGRSGMNVVALRA